MKFFHADKMDAVLLVAPCEGAWIEIVSDGAGYDLYGRPL